MTIMLIFSDGYCVQTERANLLTALKAACRKRPSADVIAAFALPPADSFATFTVDQMVRFWQSGTEEINRLISDGAVAALEVGPHGKAHYRIHHGTEEAPPAKQAGQKISIPSLGNNRRSRSRKGTAA